LLWNYRGSLDLAYITGLIVEITDTPINHCKDSKICVIYPYNHAKQPYKSGYKSICLYQIQSLNMNAYSRGRQEAAQAELMLKQKQFEACAIQHQVRQRAILKETEQLRK
jgi:hypothetical protein